MLRFRRSKRESTAFGTKGNVEARGWHTEACRGSYGGALEARATALLAARVPSWLKFV
ncbi:hypothetical protein V6Z11_A09G163700 [Gossypium hirsutum]